MTTYTIPNLVNSLFFDIESVREFKTFEDFTKKKSLDNWKKVAAKFYGDVLQATNKPATDDEIYLGKASLYPEYAKVVCIAFGVFDFENFEPDGSPTKKIYNIKSMDEAEILTKFKGQLDSIHAKNPDTILAGHNIVEYDIPFIIKRMIKHRIKVPVILQNALMAKPWEAKITDTQKDWKMGTSKFLSMDTIAEFLEIPSSKHGVVNGGSLGDYFWNGTEDDQTKLNNIATYCRHDVAVVMALCQKLALV